MLSQNVPSDASGSYFVPECYCQKGSCPSRVDQHLDLKGTVNGLEESPVQENQGQREAERLDH